MSGRGTVRTRASSCFGRGFTCGGVDRSTRQKIAGSAVCMTCVRGVGDQGKVLCVVLVRDWKVCARRMLGHCGWETGRWVLSDKRMGDWGVGGVRQMVKRKCGSGEAARPPGGRATWWALGGVQGARHPCFGVGG